MGLILTRDQVESASRREGQEHPVVAVLRYNAAAITGHHQRLEGLAYPDPWQTYVKDNFGFLADAFADIGNFSLGPLDIVKIWSFAKETGFKPMYDLAAMVSAAYGIQGNGSEWKMVPRYYLETKGEFPKPIDRQKLERFCGRLDEIEESLKDLDFYSWDTRESPIAVARQAFMGQGNKEAQKEAERIDAHHKEFSTPLLDQIDENFGNGFVCLSGNARRILIHK